MKGGVNSMIILLLQSLAVTRAWCLIFITESRRGRPTEEFISSGELDPHRAPARPVVTFSGESLHQMETNKESTGKKIQIPAVELLLSDSIFTSLM